MDYLDRLKEEKLALDDKLSKLREFLDNPVKPEGVDTTDIFLLVEQKFAMASYSRILTERITRAEAK